MVGQETIEVDYLIVGAGAMGMAFADTLVAETDATVAIVDRYGRPGGHWTVAYPYVRLHQPSASYGVNSRELGKGEVDQHGWNAGLYELASADEILNYFDQVMRKTLLPTGRVSYFPMSVYDGADPVRPDVQRCHSVLTGGEFDIRVRRRTVDATYMNVTVPAMCPPKYEVGSGVRLITPNQLPALDHPSSHYTVVGAGKTGIDACLWLLQHGVDPSGITWIMPRDAWLLDRAQYQPGPEFAAINSESLHSRVQAVLESHTVKELFPRLEASGLLLRLSPDVTPTAFRCATVTRAELDQLRRIPDIVRHGRVRSIGTGTVELDEATVSARPDTLYIDCTADGLEPRPAVPTFSGSRITLQALIPCQQVFSAAFAAHVEAAYEDDAQKNRMCAASPHPNTTLDWLRGYAHVDDLLLRWSADSGLREWSDASRLTKHSTGSLSDEQRTALFESLHAEKTKLQELLAHEDLTVTAN
ncbi:NAD(P)-binding protein [Streptomyces inhibens]|uniref:NAD(P)-binding protein n=1 Tax=Streptomyces inhibens TaxID=2293571 RepID=UPI0036C9A2AE